MERNLLNRDWVTEGREAFLKCFPYKRVAELTLFLYGVKDNSAARFSWAYRLRYKIRVAWTMLEGFWEMGLHVFVRNRIPIHPSAFHTYPLWTRPSDTFACALHLHSYRFRLLGTRASVGESRHSRKFPISILKPEFRRLFSNGPSSLTRLLTVNMFWKNFEFPLRFVRFHENRWSVIDVRSDVLLKWFHVIIVPLPSYEAIWRVVESNALEDGRIFANAMVKGSHVRRYFTTLGWKYLQLPDTFFSHLYAQSLKQVSSLYWLFAFFEKPATSVTQLFTRV